MEGTSSGFAYNFCAVNEHTLVTCVPLLLQRMNKRIKRILYSSGTEMKTGAADCRAYYYADVHLQVGLAERQTGNEWKTITRKEQKSKVYIQKKGTEREKRSSEFCAFCF